MAPAFNTAVLIMQFSIATYGGVVKPPGCVLYAIIIFTDDFNGRCIVSDLRLGTVNALL